MKIFKIMILILIATSLSSGPEKIKWDKNFKFEMPFPEHDPERVSLFSAENFKEKHRCLHNDSPLGDNYNYSASILLVVKQLKLARSTNS